MQTGRGGQLGLSQESFEREEIILQHKASIENSTSRRPVTRDRQSACPDRQPLRDHGSGNRDVPTGTQNLLLK